MQIRIFTLSVNSTEEEQEAMNRFLRSHRILEVRQQYDESRGVWSFSVIYVGGDAQLPQKTDKIDYKEVLTPEQFSVFCTLRERRKAIAKDENVPAYAIFTDKELAELAKLEELSVAAMQKVKGINSGRLEKFGDRMLREQEPLNVP